MAQIQYLKQSIDELVRVYDSIPTCTMTPDQEIVFNAILNIISENQEAVKVMQTGYFKLPVVQKDVKIGPRGGAYYINQLGNIVWLKRGQKRKCLDGTLPGASGCPAENMGGYIMKRR